MRSNAGLIVVLCLVVAIGSGCSSSDGPATPPSAGSYVFSRAWGSFGTGDGQFAFHNGPVAAGVAVDSLGNVYVADWGNHRIQKFDPDGGFLQKWGSGGSGDGQLSAPIGIAIGREGDVFVAESGNHRVQRFSAAGAYETKWGSNGTGNGQFQNPNGVTVTPGGSVYVADTFNHRIQQFDYNGTFERAWGANGTANGQFDHVYAVAVASTAGCSRRTAAITASRCSMRPAPSRRSSARTAPATGS